jgi:hypothetical protein
MHRELLLVEANRNHVAAAQFAVIKYPALGS